MPRITYIHCDGTESAVSVDPGLSVMEGSIRHNLPGILAECGGSCSCATCHVYVDRAWQDKLEAPAPEESELLEFVAGGQENSRLSCQILVDETLDGLVVRIPELEG
jgi:2Fe-2S ferredoxin